MDYLTLILLSLGLSLDDFSLAFALSLLMPSGTFKKLMVNAGNMAVAFSISTDLLPLLGWFVGLAIYGWLASFSALNSKSRKFPSILSGIILIILGILKFLELTFGI